MTTTSLRPWALRSLGSLLALVPVSMGRAAAQQEAAAPPATADYVVHEWGTFTSMVDTEGIVLEGLQDHGLLSTAANSTPTSKLLFRIAP